eukprot:621356-Pyramimonas_sp.AAC.1
MTRKSRSRRRAFGSKRHPIELRSRERAGIRSNITGKILGSNEWLNFENTDSSNNLLRESLRVTEIRRYTVNQVAAGSLVDL